MKKSRIVCVIILVLIVLFFVFVPPTIRPIRVAYKELGIPSSEQFPTGVRARSPWDLSLWNDALYVGSGDFDANTGPANVLKYDLQSKTWGVDATLPEEEINRFLVIDGRLTIVGIDPQESWELGNYYLLRDGEWTQKRVIPNGVHTFDMIAFNGAIFAGLGVPTGEYPIAVSRDGGETFEPVEMHKDGAPIDTSGSELIRVYDLFVFRGNLYAMFLYGDKSPRPVELYRYDDGCFVFDASWTDQIKFKPISYLPVRAKAEYKGHLYLTSGNLYVSDDAKTLTKINFLNNETVFDFTIENGVLYALCARKLEDGTIRTSVWRQIGWNADSFAELFYFDYALPPLSIATDGKTFYIGASYTTLEHELNGTILQIEYKK